MLAAQQGSPDVLGALRTATRALHAEAERSGFVAALLAGRATRGQYALWLRNLWPAYACMGTELRARDAAAALAPLCDERVFRAAAIESDLVRLAGPAWRALPLLPEGGRYAAHVEAAAGGGAGLVGHAYVRYLGDLNGGRVLQRVIARSLGLGDDALGYYAFPEEPAALDAVYRAGLAAAARTLGDDDGVVRAAVAAFRLNIALSAAVLASA